MDDCLSFGWFDEGFMCWIIFIVISRGKCRVGLCWIDGFLFLLFKGFACPLNGL